MQEQKNVHFNAIQNILNKTIFTIFYSCLQLAITGIEIWKNCL